MKALTGRVLVSLVVILAGRVSSKVSSLLGMNTFRLDELKIDVSSIDLLTTVRL